MKRVPAFILPLLICCACASPSLVHQMKRHGISHHNTKMIVLTGSDADVGWDVNVHVKWQFLIQEIWDWWGTSDTAAREQDWTLEDIGNWDAVVSKTDGADNSPYDTRTHNTVNEITALDPQGAVESFNLGWAEGDKVPCVPASPPI